MLSFNGEIFLAAGATDMRKSINSLAALVEGSFQMDSMPAAAFVFCNRARDRIKILAFDGNGYWLHFKRLEKGRFKWPSEPDGEDERLEALTGEELSVLLESPRVELKLRRQSIFV